MRKLVLPVVAVVAAAGVAALPSQGATPKPKQVAVKDDFFSPKKLTIGKGTKVVWTWKGKHKHNVSEANGKFRSGNKKKGTYSHTFKTKGTFLLFCTRHAPDMQMTIKVK